jgi:hypothetical protein
MGWRARGIAWLAATAAFFTVSFTAAAEQRWIHVHVSEGDGAGTRVRIQLPLSVVRAALPHLRSEGLRGGTLRLPQEAMDTEKLAEARAALAAALEGEPVEVGDPGRPLRMEREGEWLIVTAAESETDRVRLQVPLEAARKVLEDLPAEIDLLFVLDSMSETGDVEIARIEADETSVRIWLDSAPAAE